MESYKCTSKENYINGFHTPYQRTLYITSVSHHCPYYKLRETAHSTRVHDLSLHLPSSLFWIIETKKLLQDMIYCFENQKQNPIYYECFYQETHHQLMKWSYCAIYSHYQWFSLLTDFLLFSFLYIY